MSAADDALATLDGFKSLTFKGEATTADVAGVIVGSTIERTIEGASTLTIDLYDGSRKLLKSGFLNERIQVKIDDFTFELVQVRKSGFGLSVTLEDLPVAALRRRDAPLKVAPNTMTHVEFAERLVKEEPWLNFWTPPSLEGVKARVELARGTPWDPLHGVAEKREDTWTALGRIADERGWRRYVRDSQTIAYAPETYLIAQPATYTVQEGIGGVENIDFDFDSGKPSASLAVKVRSARWEIPVGSVVAVKDLGPAEGNWLVVRISRSLFSLFADVTLTQARPVIPEKEGEVTPPSGTATGSLGPDVTGIATGSVGPGAIGAAAGAAGLTGSVGAGAVGAVPSGGGEWPDDPTNLVKIGQGGLRLAAPAAASFAQVIAAFGRSIPVTDAYRSVASQVANYAKDPTRFGKPGDSAHGEGRAVDVNLQAIGAYPAGNPSQWANNPTWKALNDAFMAQGWCNYQFHNGSTKGRTSEPWHFSYQVCK